MGYNDLFGLPHVLNPTFEGSIDVGGADADLIVNGMLIDIKASVKQEIQSDWVRQLMGYLLLDYTDVYHINSIGLYMARQRILFQRDLGEAIEVLQAGNPMSIKELRGQFRAIANSVSVS